MPKDSDRSVIRFGPARLDTDKAIQRELDDLRNQVETKTSVPPGDYTTPGDVEDIVNEIINDYPPVPGGGGFIVGLPPGSQFAFVPADLLEFPVPLSSVRAFNTSYYFSTASSGNIVDVESGKLSVDNFDVLGLGNDTVMAWDKPSKTLVAYNTTGQSATSVMFPDILAPTVSETGEISGFFSMNGYLVSNSKDGIYEISGTNRNRAYFYTFNGVNKSSFYIVPPSGETNFNESIVATAPGENGNFFFVVWFNTTTKNLTVRRYSATGTLLESSTIGPIPFDPSIISGPVIGKIEHDWLAFAYTIDFDNVTPGGYFALVPLYSEDSGSFPPGAEIKYFSSPWAFQPSSGRSSYGSPMCFTISQDGILFAARQDGNAFAYSTKLDLVRINYATTSSNVYPGVLADPSDPTERPYFGTQISTGSSNTFFSNPVPVTGALAISDLQVVFTGTSRFQDEFGVMYVVPTMATIDLSPLAEDPAFLVPSVSYLTIDPLVMITDQNFSRWWEAARDPVILPDQSVVFVTGDPSRPQSGHYLFRIELGG